MNAASKQDAVTRAQICQQHPAGYPLWQRAAMLDGRPAKQQPGQPSHGRARPVPLAARHASLPRRQGQPVPLPGQLRVVLHGL